MVYYQKLYDYTISSRNNFPQILDSRRKVILKTFYILLSAFLFLLYYYYVSENTLSGALKQSRSIIFAKDDNTSKKSPLRDQPKEILNSSKSEMLDIQKTSENNTFLSLDDTANKVIEESIQSAQKIILDTWNPEAISSNMFKNRTIENFIPKYGGTPLRILIISATRSGSSIFLRILESIPGTMTYFEPLHNLYNATQFRLRIHGPPYADLAVRYVKNILACKITDLPTWVLDGNSVKMYKPFIPHFKSLNQCKLNESDICKTIKYQEETCKLAPIQSVKFTRLHLSLVEEFLANDSMNVKVIYLIRDPRAVMSSRQNVPWCPLSPECDPSFLCADYQSEYHVARRYLQKYPNKFRIQRFEDWALNVEDQSKSMLEFVGFNYTQQISEFLQTHSHSHSASVRNIFGTIRNSAEVVSHWKQRLPFANIMLVQKICNKAMAHWGYRPINNKDDLNNRDNFIDEIKKPLVIRQMPSTG